VRGSEYVAVSLEGGTCELAAAKSVTLAPYVQRAFTTCAATSLTALHYCASWNEQTARGAKIGGISGVGSIIPMCG
jgi:hypothetical protein